MIDPDNACFCVLLYKKKNNSKLCQYYMKKWVEENVPRLGVEKI